MSPLMKLPGSAYKLAASPFCVNPGCRHTLRLSHCKSNLAGEVMRGRTVLEPRTHQGIVRDTGILEGMQNIWVLPFHSWTIISLLSTQKLNLKLKLKLTNIVLMFALRYTTHAFKTILLFKWLILRRTRNKRYLSRVINLREQNA